MQPLGSVHIKDAYDQKEAASPRLKSATPLMHSADCCTLPGFTVSKTLSLMC